MVGVGGGASSPPKGDALLRRDAYGQTIIAHAQRLFHLILTTPKVHVIISILPFQKEGLQEVE